MMRVDVDTSSFKGRNPFRKNRCINNRYLWLGEVIQDRIFSIAER